MRPAVVGGAIAEGVHQRMARIEIDAGAVVGGRIVVLDVGAARGEQSRQHVGVGAERCRRLHTRRADALVNLHAAEARDEHPVRARVLDGRHRDTAGLEQRAAAVRAKDRRELRRARAHAGIHVGQPETHVEEHGVAILGAYGVADRRRAR